MYLDCIWKRFDLPIDKTGYKALCSIKTLNLDLHKKCLGDSQINGIIKALNIMFALKRQLFAPERDGVCHKTGAWSGVMKVIGPDNFSTGRQHNLGEDLI